jgi:hypothetical protein
MEWQNSKIIAKVVASLFICRDEGGVWLSDLTNVLRRPVEIAAA